MRLWSSVAFWKAPTFRLAASCSAAEAIYIPTIRTGSYIGGSRPPVIVPRRTSSLGGRGGFRMGGGELAAGLLDRGARRGGGVVHGDLDLGRQLALAEQ